MLGFKVLITTSLIAILSTIILSGFLPLDLRQVEGSSSGTQPNAVFAPVSIRTIANNSMLNELTHVIDHEGINPTHVLDWSQDGRYVLFSYDDYSKMDIWGPGSPPHSLALIDLNNGNEIRKVELEIRSAPAENFPEGYLLTIYQAKFSSSGENIFILVGGNDPENPNQPENIYTYDVKTGAIHPITSSSNVARFDIERKANDTLAYVTYDGMFHFYPQDDPQLGSKLRNLMMSNNIEPIIHQFSISPDGGQFAFPTSDGIKHMNLQNGDVRTIIPRTCISSLVFSPNSEYLIYSPHSERNCENGEDYVLRIVSIVGSSEIGELVYMDNWGWLDTVVSPDGAYLATNAQGSDERTYGLGDENDINPRIVTIQLARPVPELGNLTILILASTILALIFVTFGIRKFFSATPRSKYP